MDEGMGQTQVRAPGNGLLSWRLVVLFLGAVVVVTGVALNESGVAVGRHIIAVGLPIALAGLVLSILGRQKASSAAVAAGPDPRDALHAVAQRWGMQLEEDRASGQVRGRPVEVRIRDASGPITVRAKLNRSLDMGLTIRRERIPGDARVLVATGDTAFDNAYDVRADEAERAKALLSDRLRGHLLEVEAQLDDDGALIQVFHLDGEVVAEAVKVACKMAAELERASTKVGCASPLERPRGDWLSFAHDEKLANADTPLAIWGHLEGRKVEARAVRDAFQQYHYELVVDFDAPIDRGLVMKPAGSAMQFDRDAEPVGHPAFDKFFMLKAAVALDAARLVGPETREAILALRDAGLQVRATDKGMWAWAGFSLADTKAVPESLRKLALVAGRIQANAERYPKTG